MILSKDFIINNSIKFKKDVFGGVYFLSKNNNIVMYLVVLWQIAPCVWRYTKCVVNSLT